MKPSLKNPSAALFGLLLLVALACNLPATAPAATEPPTTEPAMPITGNELEASTSEPTAEPTLSPNAPVELPADRAGHAGDFDSSTTASARAAAGGDRFTFGRYERPFNANSMDTYFPYLDIVDTLAYQDERFVYGVITLKGVDANGSLPGTYALELDTTLDGNGDWLVLVKAPTSTAWGTLGVQVRSDANQDVGGIVPVAADKDLVNGDGYERLLADSGQGDAPEAGWARLDPNSPNTVQLAISRNVLGNVDRYLAGMWAGTASLNPAQFDFNDHMTHEQAGAADPGLESYYPIKQLAELDNSCRMAIGFAPTGKEPGLCQEALPTPEPKACRSDPAEEYACTQRGGTWEKDKCKCKELQLY